MSTAVTQCAAGWRSGACRVRESIVALANTAVGAVKIFGGAMATAMDLGLAGGRNAAIAASVTSLALALATISAVHVRG